MDGTFIKLANTHRFTPPRRVQDKLGGGVGAAETPHPQQGEVRLATGSN